MPARCRVSGLLRGFEFLDASRRPSPEGGIEPEVVRNRGRSADIAQLCALRPLARRAMVDDAAEERSGNGVARFEDQRWLPGGLRKRFRGPPGRHIFSSVDVKVGDTGGKA